VSGDTNPFFWGLEIKYFGFQFGIIVGIMYTSDVIITICVFSGINENFITSSNLVKTRTAIYKFFLSHKNYEKSVFMIRMKENTIITNEYICNKH
jgi:hypothetical protein